MRSKIIILTLFLFLLPNVISNSINIVYGSIINKLSYHEVYYTIIKNEIKFPNIVFAQSLIETGHFTSDLLHAENNLFGMKYPRSRKTTSSGMSESGYASYEKWSDSVKDYSLWQKSVLKNKKDITEEEYLRLLSRIYAEDKNYIKKIKWLIYRN